MGFLQSELAKRQKTQWRKKRQEVLSDTEDLKRKTS
jgi:hypothetical protein